MLNRREACAWPTESFINKFRDELVGETKEENAGKCQNAETEMAAAGLS